MARAQVPKRGYPGGSGERAKPRDHPAKHLEVAKRAFAFQLHKDSRDMRSMSQVGKLNQTRGPVVFPDVSCVECADAQFCFSHRDSLPKQPAVWQLRSAAAAGKKRLRPLERVSYASAGTGIVNPRLTTLIATLVVNLFTFGLSPSMRVISASNDAVSAAVTIRTKSASPVT